MGIASIIEKLFSMPVELCYILFVYNPERRLFMGWIKAYVTKYTEIWGNICDGFFSAD